MAEKKGTTTIRVMRPEDVKKLREIYWDVWVVMFAEELYRMTINYPSAFPHFVIELLAPPQFHQVALALMILIALYSVYQVYLHPWYLLVVSLLLVLAPRLCSYAFIWTRLAFSPDLVDMYGYYCKKDKWIMYVAEVDGEVAGMIGVSPADTSKQGWFKGLRQNTDAELHCLNLLPKFRGRKIASQLCDKAEEFAKEQGFSRIMLTTSSFHRVAYNHLYPSHGYKKIKAVDKYGCEIGYFQKEL